MVTGLPSIYDAASIGEVDAGEHVHEDGLATAVLTEKGQGLAAVDVKVNIVVGLDLAKRLAGVPQPIPHGWLLFCHEISHHSKVIPD